MPCCIEPVGGETDQETRCDVQTTEREIQMGLRLVVVTVAVVVLMMIQVAGAVLLLVDIAVARVVVRTGGSQRNVLRIGGARIPRYV